MSEPKWTPAQRAAIEDRGGALLVSAAAGSGKTAVLTERAVRLITDPEHPVDADRLLIVTFTNAAAAELRARIGQALLRLSVQQPHNTALRRQRMLLQRAPICTIDAFCLDLLHKHFQALDIPPDFAPADPGSVEVLRASALAETLENAYRDPDFCAFADLYGKGRTDQAAGNTILHVYDFLRALPDYDRRMDEYLAPWQQENGFGSTCWHDLLLAEAARCAGAARELLTAALADCREDFALAQAQAEEKGKTAASKAKAAAGVNDKFAEPLSRLENAAALLGEVERQAAAGEWTPLYDKLTPYVLGMEEMPGFKGMKKRLTGDHKAAVRTRTDEAAKLFEQITELISCSEEEAEADRREALPRLRALFAAVRDFDARFSAKKKERKLLEFSDFEHQALRLLRTPEGEPTPLCQSIRQNYAAVMVDEYQDTNALQDAIYRCLASPAGDDLFLVGDLKQSIYRFRQADPSIFRTKLDVWAPLPGGTARPRPAEGTPGTDALLALDANFRSAPQVVAGINFIFEQLMTPRLGDTAYGDGQRLVCGAPGEYVGSVEAHFLPDDTAETDAAWIAQRIEELVQNGTPVRDGGSVRPVQYEDCCILLAARGDFLAYEEALTARGIPVYADARENLMTAPHIRPLISLLKVIDNPAQDIYLAAAMLGPMFGFTDDDLVRLRACSEEAQKKQQEPGTKHTRMSLYGAVLQVVQSEDETPFTQKVKGFLRPADRAAAHGPQCSGRAAAGRDLCLHRLPCRAGRAGKRSPPPGGCPPVCSVLCGIRHKRHFGAGACHRCGGTGRLHRAGRSAGRRTPGLRDHHDHPPLQGPAVPGGVRGRYGPALQPERHLSAGAAASGIRCRPAAAAGTGGPVQDRRIHRPCQCSRTGDPQRADAPFVCGAHPRTGYADPDHPAGHDQDRQSLCPGGGVSGGRSGGDPEPAGKQLCRLAACGAAGASLWRAAAAAGRRSGTALRVYGKRDHRIGSGGPAGTGSVRTGAGTACSCPGRPGSGGRAAGRLCSGSTRRRSWPLCPPRSA